MEKKDQNPQKEVSAKEIPASKPHEHDEEHQNGNPMFALKVLLILIAIILVIVVLKATGVPFAIKDWLSHFAGYTARLC